MQSLPHLRQLLRLLLRLPLHPSRPSKHPSRPPKHLSHLPLRLPRHPSQSPLTLLRARLPHTRRTRLAPPQARPPTPPTSFPSWFPPPRPRLRSSRTRARLAQHLDPRRPGAATRTAPPSRRPKSSTRARTSTRATTGTIVLTTAATEAKGRVQMSMREVT